MSTERIRRGVSEMLQRTEEALLTGNFPDFTRYREAIARRVALSDVLEFVKELPNDEADDEGDLTI